MIYKLTTAQAANGAGDTTAKNLRSKGDDAGVFQLVMTGTATVTLQGSCDGTNWVTIVALTASGGQVVALFPQMRVLISGVSGTPVIDAWLAD